MMGIKELVTVFYATRRYVELVILTAMVSCYAFTAYKRNLVWKTELTFWTDCVLKSSLKARPHFALGLAFEGQENHDEAIAHYSEALRIKPNYAEAHNNLGGLYLKKKWVDKAIFHLQQAIQISPRHAKAHYNLAMAYGTKGKYRLVYEEIRLAKELSSADQWKALVGVKGAK